MIASRKLNRQLDVLNILLSDVRYGLGAYLGVYLLSVHGWDERQVGFALSVGGLAGLASAPLTGLLVDAVPAKRVLIAFASLAVCATCLVIPLAPQFGPVLLAGVVGASVGTLLAPAVSALSLGVVGPRRFAARAGRNESMFHAGNAVCNVAVLVLASFMGSSIVFWVLAVTSLLSAAAVMTIPASAIDARVARGLRSRLEASDEAPSPLWELTRNRPLLIFAFCGALFHLANAAMLGLVGQKLARVAPESGIALTAACAIAAQVVMAPTAAIAGVKVATWGWRPMIITAFGALSLRSFLYTLSDDPVWLVGVQLLDGVGAGLMGALFPVIVADLTFGSGRFSAAQAAVGAAHGVGGMLSAAMAGEIVVRFGYSAAFVTLSVIALVGGCLFWLLTRSIKPRR